MKNTKKSIDNRRKLELDRRTIRLLEVEDLGAVNGAGGCWYSMTSAPIPKIAE